MTARPRANARSAMLAERRKRHKVALDVEVAEMEKNLNASPPAPEPEGPFAPMDVTPPAPALEGLTVTDDTDDSALVPAGVPVPEGNLAALAHRINSHMLLASRADEKADDHRLSAAISLAAAKQACIEAKLPFMRWATNSVLQSDRTILLLTQVGASPDPVGALAELRQKNALANKALRERRQIGTRRQVTVPPTLSPPAEPEAPPVEERGIGGAGEPEVAGASPSQAPEVPPTVEALLEEFKCLTRAEQQVFLRQAMMVGHRQEQAA